MVDSQTLGHESLNEKNLDGDGGRGGLSVKRFPSIVANVHTSPNQMSSFLKSESAI